MHMKPYGRARRDRRGVGVRLRCGMRRAHKRENANRVLPVIAYFALRGGKFENITRVRKPYAVRLSVYFLCEISKLLSAMC